MVGERDDPGDVDASRRSAELCDLGCDAVGGQVDERAVWLAIRRNLDDACGMELRVQYARDLGLRVDRDGAVAARADRGFG